MLRIVRRGRRRFSPVKELERWLERSAAMTLRRVTILLGAGSGLRLETEQDLRNPCLTDTRASTYDPAGPCGPADAAHTTSRPTIRTATPNA